MDPYIQVKDNLPPRSQHIEDDKLYAAWDL